MGEMLFPVTLHHLLLVGVCLCVYSTPVPPLHDYAPTSQDSGCDGQAGEPMEGEPCVTPATPVSVTSTSVQSGPSDPGRLSYGMAEHMNGRWTDLSENVGEAGGTVPDVGGRKPGGIEQVTQQRNMDSHEGISGLGGAERQGREAETGADSESFSEGKETHRQPVEAPELYIDKEMSVGAEEDPMEDEPTITTRAMLASIGEKQGMTVAMNTPRSALHGASTAARAPEPDSQTEMHLAGERRDLILEERPDLHGGKEGELRESLPDLGAPLLGQETATTRPSSSSPHSILTNSPLTSIPPSVRGSRGEASSLPPIVLEAAVPATPQPQDGKTAPALPDPQLPDLGPALTGSSRQDDPDSLWTEPLQQNGAVDASAPSLQDASTEGTMSSEDLPLIFEPFDEITPEGAGVATATLSPGNSQTSVSMATTGMLLSEAEFDQVDTGDTRPSRVPTPVLPDWTLPWQTSGAEISEPISPSGPPIDSPPSETETEQPVDQSDTGGRETIQNPEETPPTSEPNLTSTNSQQTTMITVTKTTNLPVAKSGLEELESEEEPEEDEEDENTEKSEEEESEEDLNETPMPAPTRPPYSLIPPPPVWVQRNQGLMRSWVELIREKAGYVSGMLAPVGIGIMGALLIVGALYSIRMIHRKKRNSFKHQRRRKARLTEQPREPSSSGQDQAMLLADSSEDEF